MPAGSDQGLALSRGRGQAGEGPVREEGRGLWEGGGAEAGVLP